MAVWKRAPNRVAAGGQGCGTRLGIILAILVLVPWTHGATLCVKNGNGSPLIPAVYGHGLYKDCVWSVATGANDTDGISGLAFEICNEWLDYLREAVTAYWRLNNTEVLVNYIERVGGYESYAIIQLLASNYRFPARPAFCYHVYILIAEPYYHTGDDFLAGFGFRRESHPFWTLGRCCNENRTLINVEGRRLWEQGLNGNLDFVTKVKNPFSRPWICGKKPGAFAVFATPNLEIPLWPAYAQICHYDEENIIRDCHEEYRRFRHTPPEKCLEAYHERKQQQEHEEKEREERKRQKLCKQLSRMDTELRNEELYQEKCRQRNKNEL